MHPIIRHVSSTLVYLGIILLALTLPSHASVQSPSISFDGSGKTIPWIVGENLIFSGSSTIANGIVTITGLDVSPTACKNGRWQTQPIPLSSLPDGEVNIAAHLKTSPNKADSLAAATLSVTIINLLKEGVVGDGITDDTTAIKAALAKAKTKPNSIIYAPGGHTYTHSDTLIIDSAELFGAGDTTVFHASNPLKSAIYLKGDSPALRNLKLTTNLEGVRRQSTPDTARVVPTDCTFFTIDRVHLDGAASAGIFNYGGSGTSDSYALITNNRVVNTLADGIHNTRRSRYVRIIGNEVHDTGDDHIAVVSYAKGREPVSNIIIQNNKVGRQHNGRGITVVGGRNVLIENNFVNTTFGSAIYLVSETYWDTLGVENIVVRGNKCQNCVTGKTMSAIQVSGRPEHPVRNVRIESNIILDSTREGINLRSNVTDVLVTGNQLGRIADVGIRQAGSKDVVIENNALEQIGRSGIIIENTSTGSLKLNANTFLEINTRSESGHAVIIIHSNPSIGPVEITRNRYVEGKSRGTPYQKVQVKAESKGNLTSGVKSFLNQLR